MRWDETECDQAGSMHNHAQLSLDSCVRKGITLQNVCFLLSSQIRLVNLSRFIILKYFVGLPWWWTESWQGIRLNGMTQHTIPRTDIPIARQFHEPRLRVWESRMIFGRERESKGGWGDYVTSFVCCMRGQYSWDDEEIEVDGHVAHTGGWKLNTGLCWKTRKGRGHLYDLTVDGSVVW